MLNKNSIFIRIHESYYYFYLFFIRDEIILDLLD